MARRLDMRAGTAVKSGLEPRASGYGQQDLHRRLHQLRRQPNQHIDGRVLGLPGTLPVDESEGARGMREGGFVPNLQGGRAQQCDRKHSISIRPA